MSKLAENALIIGLLAWFNAAMICGGPVADQWAFHPQRVLAGEWWRLFTYAWVHLSPYHLAVDGLAVLLLAGSAGRNFGQRWLAIQACALGSALAAWLLAPEVSAIGLCGLSGAAHGLTVLAGAASRERGQRAEAILGTALALGVTGKALLETTLGHSLLLGLHLGPVGTPIPVCHLGGVLTGWFLVNLRNSAQSEVEAGEPATLIGRNNPLPKPPHR
jgi:rhomboid family GlyGly-CTERM serine protease